MKHIEQHVYTYVSGIKRSYYHRPTLGILKSGHSANNLTIDSNTYNYPLQHHEITEIIYIRSF